MVKSGKLRVGVVFGGRSGEHEVSLMSARSVLSALDTDKYDIRQIGITHEGAWITGEHVLEALAAGNANGLPAIFPASILPDPTRQGLYRLRGADLEAEKSSPGVEHFQETLDFLSELDVVFPVLHGTFGEDGTFQGLLELADLAYVGAGVLGSSLGMDKGLFKTVMHAHDIPVVDWLIATRSEIEKDAENVIQRALELAGFPLFVKPANLGSSVGITKCISRSDLLEGLYEAARFDRRVLIERGVPEAREIEISVLGNDDPQVSVPGEVIPSREFYSYEAKYVDENSELIIPAPISDELAHRVQDLAVQAYRAIDCAGMARVDFLLAREGAIQHSSVHAELYLSEVNTIPGFTRISMYPKLWQASGLSYPALVDRLIELALARKAERDHTERRFRRSN
jgi:D-alanine-D-alanine ligase